MMMMMMMIVKQSVDEWQEKLKYSEKTCLIATLSSTIPT
jgi:hypothetical protein